MSVYNYSKMKKIASSPQVGIWWLNGNNIIPFTEKAPAPLDFSYIDMLHERYWDFVQDAIPKFRSKGYTAIPRGRVESRPDGYYIMAPPDMVNDKSLIDVVRRAFNLPPNLTHIIPDDHFIRSTTDEIWDTLVTDEAFGEPGERMYEEDAA